MKNRTQQHIKHPSRRGPIALAIATALGTGAGLSSPALAALEPGAAIGPPVSLLEIAEGAEIDISAHLTGRNGLSALALDADGDGVAVWTEERQSTGGLEKTSPKAVSGDLDGVYFRRIHADGTLGETVTLTEQDADLFDVYNAKVAVDADGDAVVVWGEYDYDNYEYTVWIRQIGADDAPSGEKFQAGGTSTGSPVVDVDAAGNFAVAWQEGGVNFQRFNAAGEALGDAVNVTGDAHGVDVAVSAKGDFVIAWPYNPAVGASVVLARQYMADGTPYGEEIPVFDSADFDGNIQEVEAAIDVDGDLAFAWSGSVTTDDGHFNFVDAARFNADGNPLPTGDGELYLGEALPWITGVAFDIDGDPVVSWMTSVYIMDVEGGNTTVSLDATRLKADGTKAGIALDFDTACSIADEQCVHPQALALDADGDLLLSWAMVDNTPGIISNATALRAQRFRGAESADLAATLAFTPSEVHPGDSVTLTLTVENLHPISTYYGVESMDAAVGATAGVTLDFTIPATLPAPIDIDGWTCSSPAEESVTCTYDGQLHAAEEILFENSFEVPAAAIGEHTFGVTVSADRTDPVADNNTSEVTLTVSEAPGDDGNSPAPSGGGAFGWLGLLGLLPFIRRRRG